MPPLFHRRRNAALGIEGRRTKQRDADATWRRDDLFEMSSFITKPKADGNGGRIVL